MGTVPEDISELRAALATNAREHELLEIVEYQLHALRASYRIGKNDFTADIVVFLRSVAAFREVLREFIDSLEDGAWVRTRDDAEELATRFQDIAERLKPNLVANRAEKEVRELVEKSRLLPFAAAARHDTD